MVRYAFDLAQKVQNSAAASENCGAYPGKLGRGGRAPHGQRLRDDRHRSVDYSSDQVRTFHGAAAVFSTLGSGLTRLIYSPIGVAVTSVAPALFGDRFFYALVANRRGRYADVGGPIMTPDPYIPHRGSFTVDPIYLAQALATVEK